MGKESPDKRGIKLPVTVFYNGYHEARYLLDADQKAVMLKDVAEFLNALPVSHEQPINAGNNLQAGVAESQAPSIRDGDAGVASGRSAAGPAPSNARKNEVDEIISGLYKRFKEWSKRGFGPEDVTWCEVKADVLALLSVPSTTQAKGETPRTDAEAAHPIIGWHPDDMTRAVLRQWADFARQLERELAEGHRTCADLLRVNKELRSELAETAEALDKAEIGRKYSMDSGQTWIEYSLAERIDILAGAYKLSERELSECHAEYARDMATATEAIKEAERAPSATQDIKELESQRDNLAAFVRQFSYCVRNKVPAEMWADRSMAYLTIKGLQGTPLRSTDGGGS